MSWLPFFGKKSAADVAKRHGARAADKRAYQPDRWDSLRALAATPGKETAEALLPRFTYRIDPSITDQEEKDLAYQGVLAAGEEAVPAILAFMRKTDAVSWPLRMLSALLPDQRVTDELLALVADLTTDYERDPQRKIQLVAALEDRRDPRIVEAVTRFLSDTNEPTRYHAIAAILAQENAASAFPLVVQRLYDDESTRVRGAVLDACVVHGIKVPVERIPETRKMAPLGTVVDEDGSVRKLG
jgi:HEAT repeat protein